MNILRLYELTRQYEQLLGLAEEEEIATQVLEDTLEALEETIYLKVENTAKVIKNLEAELIGFQTEIRRLTKRKQTLEKMIKRLKLYLQEEMERMTLNKVNGELFNVRIQNNPPSVVVMDIDKLSAYYLPQEPKLDKETLLKDLSAGKEILGAKHQQTRSIRIT